MRNSRSDWTRRFLLFSAILGFIPPWHLSRMLRSQLSLASLCRLYIQYEMNGRPQEMGAVALGYERINRVKRSVRQIQIIRNHHDREPWLNLLDLRCNDLAIHQT